MLNSHRNQHTADLKPWKETAHGFPPQTPFRTAVFCCALPGRCSASKERTPHKKEEIHTTCISLLPKKCLNLFYWRVHSKTLERQKAQVAETFKETLKLLKCKRISFPSDSKDSEHVGGLD